MRLVKLELNGFKSFARKTEIRFGDGITAVVGPNGSGKSNIADAVRWVLGEQSAKALRGAKMEDVIFSGTQQKKAQSYCEVSLAFDNTDGRLPVEYSEVEVTRRVYRSGESEYCLNQTPCRLRDIQELFRDTGIGKDGYSIISQGKVDEILSNKSGDRRAALEEAAGVMRYRVRKEEAQRKLDATEKNLERIDDILGELADRLGPLEQQSATARSFLKLRDELRELEINLFLAQYDRMRERLTALAETIAQLAEESALSEESEKRVLDECALLEERVRGLDETLSAQQNALLTMLSGVETHVGESRVLIERRENLLAERARLTEALAILREKREGLARANGEMQSDETGEAAVQRLDGALAEAQARVNRADEEIEKAEAALEAMKNSIIEAMNRLSDAKSRLSHFDAMMSAFTGRAEEVSAQREAHKHVSEALLGEMDAAQTEDAAFRVEREKLLASQNAAREDLAARREVYAKAQAYKRELEQKLQGDASRLRVLTEMARSREGYFDSVRFLMRDAATDETLARSIIGVVAELIRVPAEYEQAVTMALGSALQNIVTATAEDAKRVIDYASSHDYGRVTLLPTDILRQSSLTSEERRALSAPGCIGVASELIACDPRIQGAVAHLLGRTVLVRDLDSGVALKRSARASFGIATLGGDIIAAGGSMSGGSTRKRGFSLLGREREMEQLRTRVAEQERAAKEQNDLCEQAEKYILLLNTQLDALGGELHAREIEHAKHKEKLEIIARDIETAAQKDAQLAGEWEQLQENIDDLVREREEADSLQNDIEAGNAVTREDVAAAQAALAEKRRARERENDACSDLRVRRMALQKERDAAARERARLENELLAGEKSIAGSEAALAENERQRGALDARIAEMQSGIASEQREADARRTAQHATEEERARLSESLTALRARREELIASARERSERLHRQELARSRTELELSSMQDHIWEEYELTYENALPYKREIALAPTNARIAALRQEIKELGDVNISSIEDYMAVYERHTSLTVQSDDLKKAKGDLETLVVELTHTMEAVFSEQFAIIQTNFTEVFSRLFGGGHAELRLADKRDVLGCEIDIIAQPPGKRLQLLSLLSGGERALTAIALLFALLQLKAPAFCVLDEIETSLDEVNVSRFARFLKEYARDTQFILITHRKGSMEVCDSLYGVSMEERGVSKVISARFGEAG